MKAVMLAAGIGSRLGGKADEMPPKVLLRFDGKSLLQRHIEILQRQGIDELALAVGYRHEDIEREIDAIGARGFVRTRHNGQYQEGNIVTLSIMREDLCCGEPVLLMDGDVLYDEEMIGRLQKSEHETCMLIDRDFEPGDEPVKICIRDGVIVEFRKWLSTDYDYCGESVGFFKLSAAMADRVMQQTDLYLEQGRRDDFYEEAIRDVMLTEPRGRFGFEDVTGVPWIEIDFAEDVKRAETEILPRIGMSQAAE